MRLLRWSLAALVALAAAALCPTAQASYPVPFWSFKKVTPDGKYIFVLVGEKERAAIGGFLEPEEARELRRMYPQSGLYRNDGSAVPLWTFDGFAYRDEVEVASDGVHLILHRSPASSIDDQVVSFYANGQLLRAYRVGELVDDPDRLARPDRTPSILLWQEESRFDDAKMEYTLVTKDGNRFVFDVRTGAITSASRSGRVWWRVIWAGAVIAGLLAVGFCVRRIRRRPRRPSPKYPVHTDRPLQTPD